MNMSSPDHGDAVRRVAYRIAQVVARKTIEGRTFDRLDALGKASAVHTMAERMVPALMDEAEVAYRESALILAGVGDA